MRPAALEVAPPLEARVLVLYVFLSLVVVPYRARAQEPPTGDTLGQPASPQPSTGSSSSGGQLNATPRNETALDNPVLVQADEERNITYMRSRVTFQYGHEAYDGGSSGDRVLVDWLQAFGPSGRIAAGIEFPFVHYNAGNAEPSSNGLGDIKLQVRGMIGRGEKFEHAAGLEITVPSASHEPIGEGETVLKVVWGFSMQLTPHTLLSGELA